MKAPEATRRKLLDAAFAEFFKHGFQGGSLNQIVDAAGATKGALFHHFTGKQDLGYAVVDKHYAAWRKGIAAAIAAGIRARKVKKDASPGNVAALVVASQMGIWGTGKSSRSKELMLQATEGLCEYLDELKP